MLSNEQRRHMADICLAAAGRLRAMAGQYLEAAVRWEREAQQWHDQPAPRPTPARPTRQTRALTAGQRQALAAVPLEWTTCKDIARAAGQPYSTTYARLKALIAKGVIERRESSEQSITGDDGRIYRVVGGPVQVQYRRPFEPAPEDLEHIAAELDGLGDHLLGLYDVDDEGHR